MDRLVELVRLRRMRTGSREVARLLGMGPNTERAYREALTAAGLLAGPVEELPALETLKAAVEKHAPARPGMSSSASDEFAIRIGRSIPDFFQALSQLFPAIFSCLSLSNSIAANGTAFPSVSGLAATLLNG